MVKNFKHKFYYINKGGKWSIMIRSKQKTQKTLGKISKKRTLKQKNTYNQKDILNYTPSESSIPDVSKLIIGDNLTYKQLCTLLKVPTNGGNAKKIQLEDWLRYFDYEKNGTKFLITDIYDEFCDYHLIFTKLDETSTYGNILNIKLHTGAQLSYVTTGQNVPDDIEVVDTQKLVKQLLGGR